MSDERANHDERLPVQADLRLDALKDAIVLAEYEASVRDTHLHQVWGSMSWKITAPLRRIESTFRRMLDHPVRRPEARGDRASMASRSVAGWTGLVALQRVALAEKSLAARAMLARAATSGCDGVWFAGVNLAEGNEITAFANACRDAGATLALAGVAADQRVFESDPALAMALYLHYLQSWGTSGWRVGDHVAFIDLLDGVGDAMAASQHLDRSGLQHASPLDAACLGANLVHPARHGEQATWLAALNRLFVTAALTPVALADGDAPAIDRLVCARCPLPADNARPLVSVIMPVFRPGAETDGAIASVLAQSWTHLEVIVIDDGSPGASVARLREWEHRDPRVKVLQLERNSGTYEARNLGLSVAKGEFVTCHDADDWSHPAKIERQARHLVRHRSHVANLSSWARVLPDLTLMRFSMGGSMVYPNLSSLMFRRDVVVDALGAWDPVRYGADNEFLERIATVFGRRPAIVEPTPLSFGRMHPHSLTSGTLGRGHVSFERRIYESAWASWHTSIRAGQSSPRLDSQHPRKFPVPADMLPQRDGDPAWPTIECVLVADFCMEGGWAAALTAAIRHELARGVKPALCQVRTLHTVAVARARFGEEVQQLVNDVGLTVVPLHAEIDCSRVHVLEPRSLEFTGYLQSGIRPRAVSIAWPKPDAPREAWPLDVSACLTEAGRLFGVAPQPPVVRSRPD